jgi:hypothetical protein
MSISPEDFAIGREADIRIKSYERQNPRRLITYLFPAVWVVAFIARYEARASSWNLFQLIFWSVALLGVIVFEYKRKKTYLHDLATLAELRKQHGVEISFEEKNVATNASEKVGAIKEPDHGAEISFEEKNVAASASEKVEAIKEPDTNASEKAGAIKERDEWRKLKPLFAFGIFLAAVFILPLIFHYFRVAFSK